MSEKDIGGLIWRSWKREGGSRAGAWGRRRTGWWRVTARGGSDGGGSPVVGRSDSGELTGSDGAGGQTVR